MPQQATFARPLPRGDSTLPGRMSLSMTITALCGTSSRKPPTVPGAESAGAYRMVKADPAARDYWASLPFPRLSSCRAQRDRTAEETRESVDLRRRRPSSSGSPAYLIDGVATRPAYSP